MYINMLIEDRIQKIVCEDVTTFVAKAVIKSVYEERTSVDEPVSVYLSSVNANEADLREFGSCFEITDKDTIQTLNAKIQVAIYEQMDD